MATDYDAPRKSEEDQSEESIEELKARRHDKNSGKVDEDEAEAAESFELPGADLSHEELAVEVKPKQEDEFTCMSCFLVHHRSQLADAKKLICFDCACSASGDVALRHKHNLITAITRHAQRAGFFLSQALSPLRSPGGRWPVERA